jgi:signal transduction histidine kinase
MAEITSPPPRHADPAPEPARPKIARGLSSRLLLLTIAFVMFGEVAIYVPSISNFRITWLHERLAAAQIASLVLEATPDQMVSEELRRELLANAGARTVALHRGATRRLVLSGDEQLDVDSHYDLRDPMVVMWIWDAFEALAAGDGRIIRVVDQSRNRPGDFIEIVIEEAPLRAAMIRYSINILTLSIILSILTAALVFFTLNWFMVRPIRRLTRNMIRFREDPEDPGRIVRASGRSDEIGIAERELAQMQRDLAATLQQKSHLAALGLAVSKISHDLRNMLTSAQLMSDRLSSVDDPTVRRVAPKLLMSIDRAIAFCAHTLKYGKAQEAPPHRERMALGDIVTEVFETVGAQSDIPARIVWTNAVPADLQIDADRDHLFRILMNLCRNAAEALDNAAGTIRVSARRTGRDVAIEVRDSGPGVPERARAHLFQAFQGSARPGGTGLGLAIAAELTRAHGGTIRLVDSDSGAVFEVTIPDRISEVGKGHASRQSA